MSVRWIRAVRADIGSDNDSESDVIMPILSKKITHPSLGILAVTSLLTLVSVLWQHIVSSAAVVMGHSLSYATVQGNVGTVAIVLGWGGVFLNFLATLAILLQIVIIKDIEREVDG